MTVRRTLAISTFVIGLALVAACEDEVHVTGPSNHAPALTDIPDTFVALGSTLDLEFFATDRDDDSLTFELTDILSFQEFRDGYKPDSAIDAELRRFTFTPVERDAPQRSFRITVRDGHGNADSTTFNVKTE